MQQKSQQKIKTLKTENLETETLETETLETETMETEPMETEQKLQSLECLKRLECVKKNIEKNKKKNVELIVVTKKCSIQQITPMLEHHSSFGENRVQEALEKWSDIKKNSKKIKLHAIGALQTNKVEEAVKLFDCIHTLDREKLAQALAKAMAKTDRKIPCFIQVNIGGEAQKSGVALGELDEFVRKCRHSWKLPICGLMCLPPQGKLAVPYFALLAKLAKKNQLENLSMGMSGDYLQALELGASHLRIGTAIMGAK